MVHPQPPSPDHSLSRPRDAQERSNWAAIFRIVLAHTAHRLTNPDAVNSAKSSAKPQRARHVSSVNTPQPLARTCASTSKHPADPDSDANSRQAQAASPFPGPRPAGLPAAVTPIAPSPPLHLHTSETPPRPRYSLWARRARRQSTPLCLFRPSTHGRCRIMHRTIARRLRLRPRQSQNQRQSRLCCRLVQVQVQAQQGTPHR